MMKTAPFLLAALLFTACRPAADSEAKVEEVQDLVADTTYRPELAQRLGADDYGMKSYVMAFLRSGPNPSRDSATAAHLQRAHLDNIKRLAAEGKLVLAGPFLDDGPVRGIYVFDVRTVEEARKLTETDPSIQAGALEMELHPWYGTAALQEVNALHRQIAKEGI